MRIGFFTDTYLPVIHGVTISIKTFRKNLEKSGNEVFIYTPTLPGYKDNDKNIFRFKSIKAIRNPVLRFGFPVSQGSSFRKIINFKLDIAHVHTPFSLGLIGRFIAKRQKIPLVYTHHTDYPEYVKSYLFKEKRLFPYLTKLYCLWFANTSAAVIAPSWKIKSWLENNGVKRPIHILATGIKLESFKKTEKSQKNAQDLRKKLNIAENEKVLIFVGRMGGEKNIDFLLNIFKKICQARNDIKFLLIGDGSYLKKLKLLAKNLNLKNALFLGSVPHEEIPIYYQTADIFVFSSLTDTQGIVALEALASGVPVVALKDDALKDVVIDNENGFFIKPGSPEIFAEKVLKLLEDKELYRKFSCQGEISAKNYSEENQNKKLLEIYHSVQNNYCQASNSKL